MNQPLSRTVSIANGRVYVLPLELTKSELTGSGPLLDDI